MKSLYEKFCSEDEYMPKSLNAIERRLDPISKELKKRKETLADIEKSGREDLIANVNEEMAVIKAYLPEELSREEIEKIIIDTIAEIGANTMKDMGKVMQAVKPKMAGRADNKLVNEIVKAKLA